LVEKRAGGDEAITVVTSDIEVARHARAMGADISLADLFLAAALGDAGRAAGDVPEGAPEAAEKPVSLSKKELEEWAELFRQRRARRRPAGLGARRGGDIRDGLLLVRRDPVRIPARRPVRDLGLRRRSRGAPELRAGERGPDRALRIGAGDVRSHEDQLRETA